MEEKEQKDDKLKTTKMTTQEQLRINEIKAGTIRNEIRIHTELLREALKNKPEAGWDGWKVAALNSIISKHLTELRKIREYEAMISQLNIFNN